MKGWKSEKKPSTIDVHVLFCFPDNQPLSGTQTDRAIWATEFPFEQKLILYFDLESDPERSSIEGFTVVSEIAIVLGGPLHWG